MSDVQTILLLSLLAGMLSLDATAALQVMLSQPMVAAGVAGAAVGDPGLGLLVGSALQLVWLGVLPVGAAPFPDGAVAGVVGVGGAVLLARHGMPGGLAVGGGVVLGLCAGAAGQRVTALVRRVNVRYATIAETRADDGDPGGVVAAVALGLLTRFVTAALLASAALTVSMLLRPLASLRVDGAFPTVLWAAPIAAAAVVVGGKARSELVFVVVGVVVGLAFAFLS